MKPGAQTPPAAEILEALQARLEQLEQTVSTSEARRLEAERVIMQLQQDLAASRTVDPGSPGTTRPASPSPAPASSFPGLSPIIDTRLIGLTTLMARTAIGGTGALSCVHMVVRSLRSC